MGFATAVQPCTPAQADCADTDAEHAFDHGKVPHATYRQYRTDSSGWTMHKDATALVWQNANFSWPSMKLAELKHCAAGPLGAK